jgi:hypothetical protein
LNILIKLKQKKGTIHRPRSRPPAAAPNPKPKARPIGQQQIPSKPKTSEAPTVPP